MNPASAQAANPYAAFGTTVADATPDTRVHFIRKTYLHLAAAVYGFVALEFLVFTTVDVAALMANAAAIPYFPIILLGAFLGVSWLANSWAHSDTSIGMQYAGLGLYVVFQAAIFVPLLWIAQQRTVGVLGLEMGVIPAAAWTTLGIFGVLTLSVFVTRADFSFLGTALRLGMLAAIVIAIASFFLGFSLGLLFTGFMITLMCGYILYDTSNVLHHYNPHQHVAASLALFSSIALLFWYVIRLFLAFSSDD